MQTPLLNLPTEETAWHIFHSHTHLRRNGWCTSDKFRGIHLSAAEISEVNSIIYGSDVLLEMFWTPDLSPPTPLPPLFMRCAVEIHLTDKSQAFLKYFQLPFEHARCVILKEIKEWKHTCKACYEAFRGSAHFLPPSLSMILCSIYGRKGHFYNGREAFLIDLSGYWIPRVLFLKHTCNTRLFVSFLKFGLLLWVSVLIKSH